MASSRLLTKILADFLYRMIPEHPSTGVNATHVAWGMDEILK
ncbi:MAG: hypothetical protein ABJR05_06900 [Balneola sp.]